MTDEEIREYMADLAANVVEQAANRFDKLWSEKIDIRFDQMQGKIEIRLDQMQGQIQAVAEQHSGIVPRLSGLEVGQEQIKEKLKDVQVELRAEIRRVEAGQEAIKTDIRRVETKLDHFAEDHEVRITALEA